MPLFVKLSVNQHEIQHYKITRLDRTEHPGDDDVFEYQIRKLDDEGLWKPLFKIHHRYGDGAAVLAASALDIAGSHERPATANTVTPTQEPQKQEDDKENKEQATE